MDKGLVFFTLAGVLLWLILDDFFGKGRIQSFAEFLTPDLSLGNIVKKTVSSEQNWEKKRTGMSDADFKRMHDIETKLSKNENVSNSDLQWYFNHLMAG